MAGQNFWDNDPVAAPAQPGGVQITPLMATPKQATPQTPAEEEYTSARTDKVRQEMGFGNLPAGWRLREDGTAEPIPDGPADPAAPATIRLPADKVSQLKAQRHSLTAFEQRVADIQDLYTKDFKGFRAREVMEQFGLPHLLPTSWRSKAERFNSAGGTLMGELKSALNMTGGEANAVAEIELRFGPYIPKASDSDEVIEYKIKMLGDLLKAERAKVEASLGAEPVGQGADTSGGQPSAGSDAPPGAGKAPVEVSETGEMRWATERDKAFAAQAQALFDQGGTREQLNQLAVQQGYMPYGADLDQAIDYRNRGGKGARIAAPESGYKGPSTLGALAATPVGSFVASAGNAITGGTMDEIVGMTGGDQEQAQAAKEVMRDANPLSSLAGEVAGAGLAMTGVGRIPGVAAKVPMLAREMAYGATYGAGESNDDRLGGAAVGAGAAFVGDRAVKAVRGVARRYANRAASAEQAAGRETFEAGQRQGVDVMPADVGGPFVRRMTGAAAQGPVSAMPVIRRAQQVTAQAQEARDRIAAEIGEALEPEAAGQAANRGAKAFIGRTSARARTLYNQAEAMARGVEVPLTKAVATLDQHVAELEGIPGGAEGLGALKTLREEMEGNFTVQGIRGMRTQLRDRFISTGLRGSDLERRVNQVIDAATDDIADGLQAQGLADAASAYRAADRYWRARVRTIDKALEPIIGTGGEKSGEEIMGALNKAAKGNAARLAAFVRALPEDEQAIVRSTFVSQLGRASPGAQDAAGNVFSLPQFLTHWNQLTPGAKRVLFAGESRAALDDLAKVAEGTKQAQRYQNFSNTAGGLVGQGALSGTGFLVGGPLGVIGSAIAQYGGGMLLASPKFARWLARAPKEGQLSREYIDKLQRIAATEAPIAAEVTGLRQALLGAANDNGMISAAASPGSEQEQNRP